jgi:hypothetical protein
VYRVDLVRRRRDFLPITVGYETSSLEHQPPYNNFQSRRVNNSAIQRRPFVPPRNYGYSIDLKKKKERKKREIIAKEPQGLCYFPSDSTPLLHFPLPSDSVQLESRFVKRRRYFNLPPLTPLAFPHPSSGRDFNAGIARHRIAYVIEYEFLYYI